MHFSRPMWNRDFAALFVRVPLGGYFLLAGRYKLLEMDTFVATVKQLGLLPNEIATLYAVLLPYLEVGVGALLLCGMFTTLASIVASVLLCTFIFAIGITPDHPALFNKDFILLGAALSLLSSGAGSLSVDTFRTRG